jgi:hypothetical protein
LPQFYTVVQVLENQNMDDRLFGPEWYAFLPEHYCPRRRVVRRENIPKGSVYFNDTLECGHVVRRVTGLYEFRRCGQCMPQLPYLDREVAIIEDGVVPYVPGDPRKKGWCFVSDPEGKIPCVRKTRYLLVHPGFASEARRVQQENVEKQKAANRNWWRKKKEAER